MKRRTSPSVPIFFPDWLEIHGIADNVRASLESVGRGRLLDVGCGEKPFRVYGKQIAEWIGLDLEANPRADVHGTIDAVPFADDSFDTILCTQVLEHVSKPKEAVAELFRVVRPGGHVIVTAPQYWPLHEQPYDFFRYTRYGLAALFEGAGFTIVTQKTIGSGFRLAAIAFNLTVSALGERLPYGTLPGMRALFCPIYLINNLGSVALDRLLPDTNNVMNNLIVVRKPG